MEVMEVDNPNDQRIFCWGSNASGELGIACDGERDVKSPTEFPGLSEKQHIVGIACGKQHSVFLLDTGLVYSCGRNEEKQLGRGGDKSVPGKITSLETFNVIQAACGDFFTIVLTSDKHIYGFGSNDKRQLGSEDCSSSQKPKRIKGILPNNKVVQVVCGARHCLALTSNGKIFSWGDNGNGQLGLGNDKPFSQEPNEVKALSNLPIYMVAAGGSHSFALTVSGALFAWGKNSSGQLGLGDEKDRKVPTLVASLRSKYVTYVCCGSEHTAVLTKFGRIFTFGCGKNGQLGHGGLERELNPKQVLELTGNAVIQIACGSSHTIALVEGSRNLYSFGNDRHGQLGTTQQANSQSSPVLVNGKWEDEIGNKGFHTHNIVSGGNRNFIVLQNRKDESTRNYQRERSLNDRTTCFLDEMKVDEIVRKCKDGSGDEKKQALEIVKTVFESSSCLNGSFLDPETHETTGLKNHGLDVRIIPGEKKSFVLRNITGKLRKCTQLQDTLYSALLTLLRGLKGVPADLEAIRTFLIIPEVIPPVDDVKRLNIIRDFGERILELKEEVIKLICTWWSILPSLLFLNIVRSFKCCVRSVMEDFENSASNIEKMKTLQISLCVLNLLNKVNDEGNHIIPYEAFYVQIIKKKIDITRDFLMFFRDRNSFSFCTFPFVFDAEAKSAILAFDAKIHMHHATEVVLTQNMQDMLTKPDAFPSSPYLVFFIRRNYLVQDTLRQIDDIRKNYQKSNGQKETILQFQRPLKIVFENEEGIDWGGLRKEFFLLLIEEIFDQKYGMFKEIENTQNIWFNSQSFEDPEMFFLIGVACGLALYNSVIINVHFPPVLYKKLLHQKTNFSDFTAFDPNYARTLEYLLAYPKIPGEDAMDDVEEKVGTVKDTFGLTFQVEEEKYGKSVFVDLIENGGDIEVDEQNREQFVDKLVDYYLNTSIKQQYDKFEEGFYSVCNRNFLTHFIRPNEVMEMISGCEDYSDFMLIRENTTYKPEYHKDHPLILEFWNIIENFDLEWRKKFLAFLTGSDRIPIHGLKRIEIVISPMECEKDTLKLPVAHTCFNHLVLPKYERGLMKERIEYALENFSTGFGLE